MTDKSTKPQVHCVMMTTLDGKIGSGVSGVDIVDDYLDVYRTVDDGVAGPYNTAGVAWMCGRETSKLYFADKNTSALQPDAHVETIDFFANKALGRFFITVDTKGTLRWKSNAIEFFPEHGPLHLIIIVIESTPKNYLAYLKSKDISYIVAGSDTVNFDTVLTKIHTELNISTLLLEGGGKLNGSFMTQGLIDEIHLLLLPRVLNKSDAPSLFDAQNSEATFANFELVKTAPQKRSSVLLHYRKK